MRFLWSAKYTQKAKLISGRRGFRKNKNKARGISPTQKQNNRGISPTGFSQQDSEYSVPWVGISQKKLKKSEMSRGGYVRR